MLPVRCTYCLRNTVVLRDLSWSHMPGCRGAVSDFRGTGIIVFAEVVLRQLTRLTTLKIGRTSHRPVCVCVHQA